MNDEKPTPFDFIKSISHTKKNILKNPKDYTPYIVNKGLSYFPDTILFANEMNRLWMIPPQQQYDFLIHSVRPRERYSKWNKKDKEKEQTINNICSFYNCSPKIAKQYMASMDEEDIEYINNIMSTK